MIIVTKEISSSVFEGISKLILGEDVFHKALELITILDTQSIPNGVKRQAVIDDLIWIAKGITEILLGIGIDLTVQYLRTVSKENV